MQNADEIELKLQDLQNELIAQKKVTKNALRFSIIIGLVAIFFIALNFSVLLTIAGGVAGSERKIQVLQEKLQKLDSTPPIESTESKTTP